MEPAQIDSQLAIHEYPGVIVTGEVEALATVVLEDEVGLGREGNVARAASRI